MGRFDRTRSRCVALCLAILVALRAWSIHGVLLELGSCLEMIGLDDDIDSGHQHLPVQYGEYQGKWGNANSIKFPCVTKDPVTLFIIYNKKLP